jgi:hypothetical protein
MDGNVCSGVAKKQRELRAITHAKTCAEMLREQIHGVTIVLGIGFRKIGHGLNEEALSFDVSRIRGALGGAALGIRSNGDCKNFGHISESVSQGHSVRGDVTPNRCLYKQFCFLLPGYYY